MSNTFKITKKRAFTPKDIFTLWVLSQFKGVKGEKVKNRKVNECCFPQITKLLQLNQIVRIPIFVEGSTLEYSITNAGDTILVFTHDEFGKSHENSPDMSFQTVVSPSFLRKQAVLF